MFKDQVIERFHQEFGNPDRTTVKVTAFNTAGLGVVVQTDQPNREDAAFVWLPYPPDDQPVPEIALEYAGDSGRHSGTHASAGLEKGQPALKLILRSDAELNDVVAYIKAFAAKVVLPSVNAAPRSSASSEASAEGVLIPVDMKSMPAPKPVAPRREAIPGPCSVKSGNGTAELAYSVSLESCCVSTISSRFPTVAVTLSEICSYSVNLATCPRVTGSRELAGDSWMDIAHQRVLEGRSLKRFALARPGRKTDHQSRFV